MKKNMLLGFFLSFVCLVNGQDALMSHFSRKQMNAHPLIWEMTEDSYGRLWFANNDGVVRFDGNNWTTFHTPHPVRSLAFNDKQELFVACLGDIGIVRFMHDGSTSYISLKKYIDLPKINHHLEGKLLTVNGEVYFYSTTHLMKMTLKEGVPQIQITDIGQNLGCFSDGKTLYINTLKKGLLILSGSKFKDITNGNLLAGKQLSNIVMSTEECLIATNYDGLFSLKPNGMTALSGAVQSFAKKGTTGITQLANGDLAVATFHDGVKLFSRSGNEKQTLQLPSNETYSIFKDHEKNIWVGQLLGLSHVLVNEPIQTFPDLVFSGYATAIQSINNTLYLATTGGLYTIENNPSTGYYLVKKMNGECWNLMEAHGSILIASTDGLFELSGQNIKPIIQNESFVNLQQSNLNEDIYAFGSNGCVRLIKTSTGNWSTTKITQSLQQSLYETADQYWLGSYYDGLSSLAKSGKERKEIPAALTDGSVRIRLVNGKPIFQSATAVYTLENGTFQEDAQLTSIFLGSKNNTFLFGENDWLYTNSALKQLKNNSPVEQSPAYLIHGKPTALYAQGNQLWVAFEDKLYLVQTDAVSHVNPSIFVNRLVYGKGNTAFSGFFTTKQHQYSEQQEYTPEIPFAENSVWIEFGLNSYLNPSQNRYRYYIEELGKEWSDWQEESFLNLKGMNGGTYKLHVQGKDALGAASNEVLFTFYIQPPFYKSGYAYLLYGCGLFMLIYLLVFLNNRRLIAKNKQLEKTIGERTQQLASEKKKSDDLLLNILPEEVATELKETGETQAKQYANVSVLFTDFVNFTGISSQLTPEELIAEIHFYFTAFDKIVEANHVEKIKTIGDSYMAACGLPIPTTKHAVNLVNAAKQMQAFMLKVKEERMKESKIYFDIRIGINSGPVVAGVVGKKKFAYDIWGDTVNVASRMESNSEAGKINISGSTYGLVRNEFTCDYRGKISAKNKGEVDMYFVK
jgi:class 3 adenylate cyclase/ligand-binding sensor domain-containing protein